MIFGKLRSFLKIFKTKFKILLLGASKRNRKKVIKCEGGGGGPWLKKTNVTVLTFIFKFTRPNSETKRYMFGMLVFVSLCLCVAVLHFSA